MVNIKCNRCGATSTGNTIIEARDTMNHAVGLSRGIKCGDNYNCIEEIIKETINESKIEAPKQITDNPKSKYKK